MNEMRNTLRRFWRQVSTSAIAMVPTISAVELAKSSWAESIRSYNALPVVYKPFFEPFIDEGRKFPYTVLTPSYERFIHRTTEKLISDFGHEIYVLERTGKTFQAQCYPREGISYVEVRTVLLDSQIKIRGVTKDGALSSSIFRFNSVSDHLFTPILKNIRHGSTDARAAALSPELEKFNRWVSLNYKFMSYAKRSLAGGEKVIHAILQPEIRAGVVKVRGKTIYRTISPTHACILTDRELIMIREEKRRAEEDKYGGIWDYIPLSKITDLSLREKDSNLLEFTIFLPQGDRLEFLFQTNLKQEIDQMLERFKESSTE